jgi:translation initiation factor 4E
MSTKLKSDWSIWYHHEKDNWKLSGYKKIYTMNTVEEFWKFYNNWDKVGGVTNKHFFLMKNTITPVWEDPMNINGGCWSFKIQEEQAEELWEDLSSYLVCNTLCPTISDEIVGISICLKKNSNTVVKIWNKKSKNNSLKLINEEILKKWGMDIIYIAHMPGV